ncbi:hypothetical protein [Hyphococcus sp.]|uniref:hypothetical protein n=1 Tax=Hyphococcus sp. TaxID=2038636 RepID=UPI003CCBAE64
MARFTLKDWANFLRENAELSEADRDTLAEILEVAIVSRQSNRKRLGLLTDDEIDNRKKLAFHPAKLRRRFIDKLIDEGNSEANAILKAAERFGMKPRSVKSDFYRVKKQKNLR